MPRPKKVSQTQLAHELGISQALVSLVLNGRKAGFIFNQHASGLAFWKGLEAEVERRFKPAAMHRVYKENTWAPAPKAEVEKLIGETDYVLVGLGA